MPTSTEASASDTGPVSLYRRFRPTKFSELVGQEPVVRVLHKAVSEDRPQHAYLFSGPRGTGKTTTARILAKALNCERPVDGDPCGTCEACKLISHDGSMDIIELDAASNNGVDRIREITRSASVSAYQRRRIIILDEVHMLSPAASNALLKTLEEPPEHVVFVLATTSPQSVLETIKSRSQHLTFRLVDAGTMRAHLADVARRAHLDVSDIELDAAVRRGRGSVRDAMSALDVISSGGGSPADDCGLALADALLAGDVKATLSEVALAVKAGVDPRQLAEGALDELREVFLTQMGAVELLSAPARDGRAELARQAGPRRCTAAMAHLGDALDCIKQGHDPRIAVEVAAVRAARVDVEANLAARVSKLEQQAQPAHAS
jgi:DNA polymerase-3 subunit gamma/tau